MLSSAKIGRSSWRYYQRTVAGGACEYYAEHGDTAGRWYGSGLVLLGLTAGASTPEHFVRDTIAQLKSRGFDRLENFVAVREDIHFALPRELSSPHTA